MYAAHFGLTERPFSLAPDPRYLYLSDAHREALAHLLYGLGEGGSFVQLTGEVGTGKTTVCRALLEQLPADVDVAMIFNSQLTSLELLAAVCDELRVPYPAGTKSLKVLIDALSHALLDAHARRRRTVLIIDEAQNLSSRALEEVRLLTNLETTKEKLLQVILIGQPELAEHLARRNLRQLAQRVTARYHLRPFSEPETHKYIQHPPVKPLIDIPRMAEISEKMVRDALDAFVKRDALLARDVLRRDDEVDELKDQVFRELLTYMMADPGTIQRALALILISRNLERIADHATNIAEDVIFIAEAKDVRHHAEEAAGKP